MPPSMDLIGAEGAKMVWTFVAINCTLANAPPYPLRALEVVTVRKDNIHRFVVEYLVGGFMRW